MTSSQTIHLTKHHGLGNDFLIAVEPGTDLSPVDAVSWCDRRTGVGADGLIITEPLADNIWSMLLYNADGSRAEISGNGIRCLGQALGQHLGVDLSGSNTHTLSVRTDGGLRTLELSGDRRSDTIQAKVDMGPAKPGPKISQQWNSVGVNVIQQAGVDIGNPHLIVEVAEPAAIDIAAVGPVIEADYTEGVNIHFVAVTADNAVRVHTWERGAGLTQACGSGACASVYQLNQWGRVGTSVDVTMPGGSAHVALADTIFLQGPATFIARVELSR